MILSLDEKPSWYIDALLRLWAIAAKQAPNIAVLLVYPLCEEGFRELLFFTGWEESVPMLQKELVRVWIENASPKSMRQLYERKPHVREYLYRDLLFAGEKRTREEFRTEIVHHLSDASFSLLMQLPEENVEGLLEEACIAHPDKRAKILHIVQSYVKRHYDMHLVLWLRRQLFL